MKEARIYTIEFRNDATQRIEHYSMAYPFRWIGQNMKYYPKGISGLTIRPATEDNLYLPF